MGLGSDEKGALVSLCGYLPDLGLDSSLPAGPPRTELGLPHSPSALCSDLLLQPLKTPVCQSNHLCKCLFLPSLQMSVPPIFANVCSSASPLPQACTESGVLHGSEHRSRQDLWELHISHPAASAEWGPLSGLLMTL